MAKVSTNAMTTRQRVLAPLASNEALTADLVKAAAKSLKEIAKASVRDDEVLRELHKRWQRVAELLKTDVLAAAEELLESQKLFPPGFAEGGAFAQLASIMERSPRSTDPAPTEQQLAALTEANAFLESVYVGGAKKSGLNAIMWLNFEPRVLQIRANRYPPTLANLSLLACEVLVAGGAIMSAQAARIGGKLRAAFEIPPAKQQAQRLINREGSARAVNKMLATGSEDRLDVIQHTDIMELRDVFLKVLSEHASHLSVARRRELAELFAAACDPVKPMKWAQKPEGESFETFIAREYRDRGYVAAGVTAADVGRYDPQFEEIYRTNLKRNKVPADCRLAKAGPMAKVTAERQFALNHLMI